MIFKKTLTLVVFTMMSLILIIRFLPYKSYQMQEQYAQLRNVIYGNLPEYIVTNSPEKLNVLKRRKNNFEGVKKKVSLVVRSYYKDRKKLENGLLTSYKMFINSVEYPLTVILDNESEKDHEMGDEIVKKFKVSVIYEDPPNDTSIFHGTAFPNTKYARPGYDRQQWSTFYFDRHFPDSEIIGVVDSDIQFFGFLTDFCIFNEKGQIKVAALHGHFYGNDKYATDMKTELEYMYPNRMPMFFWKNTLKNVRSHVSKILNTNNFDKAFSKFSRQSYSQFNIIYTYAKVMESNIYEIVAFDNPLSFKISVAANYAKDKEVQAGCCLIYSVNCAGVNPKFMNTLVLRYDFKNTTWLKNEDLLKQYLDSVRKAMSKLPESVISQMKNTCAQKEQNDITEI